MHSFSRDYKLTQAFRDTTDPVTRPIRGEDSTPQREWSGSLRMGPVQRSPAPYSSYALLSSPPKGSQGRKNLISPPSVEYSPARPSTAPALDLTAGELIFGVKSTSSAGATCITTRPRARNPSAASSLTPPAERRMDLFTTPAGTGTPSGSTGALRPTSAQSRTRPAPTPLQTQPAATRGRTAGGAGGGMGPMLGNIVSPTWASNNPLTHTHYDVQDYGPRGVGPREILRQQCSMSAVPTARSQYFKPDAPDMAPINALPPDAPDRALPPRSAQPYTAWGSRAPPSAHRHPPSASTTKLAAKRSPPKVTDSAAPSAPLPNGVWKPWPSKRQATPGGSGPLELNAKINIIDT